MIHNPNCQTVTLAENATNRWWPVCDCGAVDPSEKLKYGISEPLRKPRSNKMQDIELDLYCEWCGESGHEEEDCPDADVSLDCESYDIRDFIGRLETFLEGELDTISRGNVFMAENGEGVSLNILIGAPFADNGDETLNQINLIIAPTDRTVLGSEGLTIHDMEKVEEDDDDSSPFDEAMRVL